MSDLADRISRYSYKPGWALTVGEHEGKPALVVLAEVPDVLGRKERFILRGAKTITPAVERMSDQALDGWVDALLEAMETHERREWLRRDGKPVNDPHAPKETT
jgi:hypothetical protein